MRHISRQVATIGIFMKLKIVLLSLYDCYCEFPPVAPTMDRECELSSAEIGEHNRMGDSSSALVAN